MNPFMFCPSFKALTDLPVAQRLEALAQPERRSQILAESVQPTDFPAAPFLRNFDSMFELGESLNYEPLPGAMIRARARATGMTPQEVAYDAMLARGGRALLVLPATNFVDKNLDVTLEMLNDDNTVLGLSDGGAHLGFLCDASVPTFMLTHWVRDRVRTGRLTLGAAVKAMTADTARVVGLLDRGRIAPGYKADLNVIDWDRLTLRQPEVVYDLPNGGRRLTQRAEGYAATIVSGQIVYRDGVATGALPGRLVRGHQSAP
jgi:N-acyl-D-aspartate/D-glutamate deacylase